MAEFQRESKTFSQVLDFTRGSTGTYFDASGVLQTAAVDEPRFTRDPESLEAQGLLIEEQRTNLWIDSSGNDATVGVIGSGGALPSGWAVEVGSGLSVEVLQNDINADLGGCRLRISGTADGNLFRLKVSQGDTISAGVTVTGSNHIKGVSGNLSGISDFRLTLVNISMAETFFDPFNFDKLTVARHDQTGAPLTDLLIRHEIRFSTTNGIGVDITLDIGGAQLEQGSFPTSYIKTEGSQVTRSADNCSRTLGSEYNSSEGRVEVTATANIGDTVISLGAESIVADVDTEKTYTLTYNTDPSATTLDIMPGATGTVKSVKYSPRETV